MPSKIFRLAQYSERNRFVARFANRRMSSAFFSGKYFPNRSLARTTVYFLVRVLIVRNNCNVNDLGTNGQCGVGGSVQEWSSRRGRRFPLNSRQTERLGNRITRHMEHRHCRRILHVLVCARLVEPCELSPVPAT